jgi:hypothetical protein
MAKPRTRKGSARGQEDPVKVELDLATCRRPSAGGGECVFEDI